MVWFFHADLHFAYRLRGVERVSMSENVLKLGGLPCVYWDSTGRVSIGFRSVFTGVSDWMNLPLFLRLSSDACAAKTGVTTSCNVM